MRVFTEKTAKGLQCYQGDDDHVTLCQTILCHMFRYKSKPLWLQYVYGADPFSLHNNISKLK